MLPVIRNTGLPLRDYQHALKRGVFDAWRAGARDVVAISPTGSGKCLGIDTPVMMFDGSVIPVQDVKEGDLVMGPDSSPRRVVGIARGVENLYRVVPVKGDSYVVNESHILSLKMTGMKCRVTSPDGAKLSAGDVHNLSVADYLKGSKTFKHVAKGWRVGVDYESQKTPALMPPYLLGLWLGDGNVGRPEITNTDPEVIGYLRNFAEWHGLRLSKHGRNDKKADHFRIVFDGGRNNPFVDCMRWLGLDKVKHIPRVYLFNDRATRLHLLAGILDTDGYYQNGFYEIAVKEDLLAEQVLRLARSLGFAAYDAHREKTCYNTMKTAQYHIITISGELSEIPCIVERRKARPRKQKKDVLMVGIKSVDALGPGEYFGFELEGPDRLFLLGDFTVTHNTRTSGSIVHEFTNDGIPVVISAHRQELVGQLSLAMAKEGIHHNLIAAQSTIRMVSNLHVEELGRSFYHPQAPAAVTSVQTLLRRKLGAWPQSVGLYVTDEAHHVLADNQWGRARQLFPNALGLGVTATPDRADGKGLGRHADGLFDVMVEGPLMRELIQMGFLTDYRVFCPPSDLDLSAVGTTAGGDYNRDQLGAASRKSHIVGDVVEHYLRIAAGKRGITFAVDVEDAQRIADQFNERGVPAIALSARNTDAERNDAIRKFGSGEYLQLVNVDLFGEGFDLPAIEVVSLARPTQSYSLHIQQIGRALRPLDGKQSAFIIDHVGNIDRFIQKGRGLPDTPQQWTLDRREKRASKKPAADVIALTTCLSCFQAYHSQLAACTWCGAPKPAAGGRSGPERVEGDLYEMPRELLDQLRGEIERIDESPEAVRARMLHAGAPMVAAAGAAAQVRKRQQAQQQLRDVMATYGGFWEFAGMTRRDAQVQFFKEFGVDVLQAQTLGRAEAETLAERVRSTLEELGVLV